MPDPAKEDEKDKAPPPPEKTPADGAELAELRKQLKEAQEKVATGQLAGASESTMHAVLEHIKALRAEIAELKSSGGGTRGFFGF